MSGRHSGVSDAGTAQRLGYDHPQKLYQQIHHDGHPICPVCGKMYVPKPAKHCARFDGRERQPKSWLGAEKLPPAENAIPLFKQGLELLGREVEKLRGREEFLQNERFVGERYENDKRKSLGAKQSPPEPLTTLIALYALNEDAANSIGMSRLLSRLHPSEQVEIRRPLGRGFVSEMLPDPSKVDLDRLGEAIGELRLAAEHVAQLVRGKSIRRGPSTGELLVRHHAVLEAVNAWSRDGDSDQEIARELNSRYDFGIFESEFTAEEVRRVRESSAAPPK